MPAKKKKKSKTIDRFTVPAENQGATIRMMTPAEKEILDRLHKGERPTQ